LIAKKMMSVPLTLLFTCLAFFCLGEFQLSLYDSCFLPRTLVYSLPGSPSYFSRDLHNISQNWMTLLCRIHLDIASGQIHDS
jgi:hypothetical protein